MPQPAVGEEKGGRGERREGGPCLHCHWLLPQYKSGKIAFFYRHRAGGDSRGHRHRAKSWVAALLFIFKLLDASFTCRIWTVQSMKDRRMCQVSSLKASMDQSQSVKCKIVVVGDSQCGKTALLHVFAKDCFPEVRHPHADGHGPKAAPIPKLSHLSSSMNRNVSDFLACQCSHPFQMRLLRKRYDFCV